MIIKQEQHIVATPGRGMTKITDLVADIVTRSNCTVGTCNIFVHHTSASLIINENADIAVQRDMEAFFTRLIPDGDPLFMHTDEGDDDMPAHVRSVLTETSLTIPITEKKIVLGQWQGIYLWEHRFLPHNRKITVTVMGI